MTTRKNAKKSTQKEDTSPYTCKTGKKIDHQLNIRENIKWTDKQQEFFKLFKDKDTKLILLKGPAGTSKTLVTVLSALRLMNEKKADKIIYVRTAVESSDTKLLALPGGIADKLGPFLAPLQEKLDELLCEQDVKFLIESGAVEGTPTSYLRGRNFGSNKVVIADEVQSFTYKEIITMMTRVGDYSKVVLIFDPLQSDLPKGKGGGIDVIWDIFSDIDSYKNGIRTFEFGPEDIVRSKLVKFIVEKLEVYKKKDS